MPTEYIPVDDAKQTVEKIAKPKPTTAQLTTIERPGKPNPSKQLENKRIISNRKRRKPTSDYTKDITKKDSILIITEKPQAAQKIAFALGNPTKHSDRNASFFELTHNNEKIIVASAVGHLFNLTYVSGQKGWPVFNIEWTPSYKNKNAAFTKIYFDLLKKLSKRAKEFIIATDYDIEGEVIGWNVLRFIFDQQTAKRMKYSTLTKNELIKAYENPLSEPDWGQAYAGETRHILDWLYGINLSRALMSAIKTSGSFKILSIGRVQGPALKIIVDREREIENFKPLPFWQIIAISNNIEFKHPKDIFDKSSLELFKNIKKALAETKNTEEYIKPPVPFDLTTLQREAYRHHGISPSATLQAAQKLYLDGLISYPRTSSQKIPESIEPKKILKALEKNFSHYTKFISRSKPVEGKKTDPAHPSIYPTGDFKTLEERELKLYNLIVKRFISAFSPDAITSNKKIKLTTNVKDKEDKLITFTTSGLKILEKGWTQIYPAKMEEIDLPDLSGQVNIDELRILEKETQPPKRYTPTSLITILEKKNLGTKTTRSIIIDTLFNRGYLDGKSIKATPLGMRLISSLEKHSPIIIDENLTKKMEEEMEDLLNSKKGFEEKEKATIKKAERIITDISKEFKTKEKLIGKELLEGIVEHRREEQENNTLILCPTCKKGNLRILYSRKIKRSFVACSAYPDCKQTYSLPPNSLIKKSDKTCPECNFPKLLSLKKGKRPWDFCFNPICPINIKRQEDYKAKKNVNN
jgi:DNA topoisomerase I